MESHLKCNRDVLGEFGAVVEGEGLPQAAIEWFQPGLELSDGGLGGLASGHVFYFIYVPFQILHLEAIVAILSGTGGRP